MPNSDRLDELEHDTMRDGGIEGAIPVRPEPEEKVVVGARADRERLREAVAEAEGEFEDWMDPRNPALWVGED